MTIVLQGREGDYRRASVQPTFKDVAAGKAELEQLLYKLSPNEQSILKKHLPQLKDTPAVSVPSAPIMASPFVPGMQPSYFGGQAPMAFSVPPPVVAPYPTMGGPFPFTSQMAPVKVPPSRGQASYAAMGPPALVGTASRPVVFGSQPAAGPAVYQRGATGPDKNAAAPRPVPPPAIYDPLVDTPARNQSQYASRGAPPPHPPGHPPASNVKPAYPGANQDRGAAHRPRDSDMRSQQPDHSRSGAYGGGVKANQEEQKAVQNKADDRRPKDDRRSEQRKDDRQSEQRKDDRWSEQRKDDRWPKDERRSEQKKDDRQSEQRKDDRRSEQRKDDRQSEQRKDDKWYENADVNQRRRSDGWSREAGDRNNSAARPRDGSAYQTSTPQSSKAAPIQANTDKPQGQPEGTERPSDGPDTKSKVRKSRFHDADEKLQTTSQEGKLAAPYGSSEKQNRKRPSEVSQADSGHSDVKQPRREHGEELLVSTIQTAESELDGVTEDVIQQVSI